MSGGSYSYLYIKDAEDIFSHTDELACMSARLNSLGYADDVGKETDEIIALMDSYRTDMDKRLQRISGVWRAMEWWDSCDTSEESFRQALERYREKLEAKDK